MERETILSRVMSTQEETANQTGSGTIPPEITFPETTLHNVHEVSSDPLKDNKIVQKAFRGAAIGLTAASAALGYHEVKAQDPIEPQPTATFSIPTNVEGTSIDINKINEIPGLSDSGLDLNEVQNNFSFLVDNGFPKETFTSENIKFASAGTIDNQNVYVFIQTNQVEQNLDGSAFCFIKDQDGSLQFLFLDPKSIGDIALANGINIDPNLTVLEATTDPSLLGIGEMTENGDQIKFEGFYRWHDVLQKQLTSGQVLDNDLKEGLVQFSVDVPSIPATEVPVVTKDIEGNTSIELGGQKYNISYKPLEVGIATPEVSHGDQDNAFINGEYTGTKTEDSIDLNVSYTLKNIGANGQPTVIEVDGKEYNITDKIAVLGMGSVNQYEYGTNSAFNSVYLGKLGTREVTNLNIPESTVNLIKVLGSQSGLTQEQIDSILGFYKIDEVTVVDYLVLTKSDTGEYQKVVFSMTAPQTDRFYTTQNQPYHLTSQEEVNAHLRPGVILTITADKMTNPDAIAEPIVSHWNMRNFSDDLRSYGLKGVTMNANNLQNNIDDLGKNSNIVNIGIASGVSAKN